MPNAELGHLRAIRVATLAVVAQIDARIQALAQAVPEAGPVCPQCKGQDLAEAGDVLVCADCNTNSRDGQLVS